MLANEIRDFIYKWAPGNKLGRISFLAHSLGGVIVRSALTELSEFKN